MTYFYFPFSSTLREPRLPLREKSMTVHHITSRLLQLHRHVPCRSAVASVVVSRPAQVASRANWHYARLLPLPLNVDVPAHRGRVLAARVRAIRGPRPFGAFDPAFFPGREPVGAGLVGARSDHVGDHWSQRWSRLPRLPWPPPRPRPLATDRRRTPRRRPPRRRPPLEPSL